LEFRIWNLGPDAKFQIPNSKFRSYEKEENENARDRLENRHHRRCSVDDLVDVVAVLWVSR
jgi:hypothetical protein